MTGGRVRVGTSGWSYRGWIGPFYAQGTPTARMLTAYADAGLDTVEAHSTYRRRPTETALTAWASAVPESFRFAPKAHAAITHQRDLAGVEDRVQEFFAALSPLGMRCGPVLFALPHRHVDLERLDKLLAALPDGARAAFELSPEWRQPDVVERLEGHGATLVTVDRDDALATPPSANFPFAYVRLRRDRYSTAEIEAWANRLRELAAGGDVYAFVRHDDAGDAPRWAQTLREQTL